MTGKLEASGQSTDKEVGVLRLTIYLTVIWKLFNIGTKLELFTQTLCSGGFLDALIKLVKVCWINGQISEIRTSPVNGVLHRGKRRFGQEIGANTEQSKNVFKPRWSTSETVQNREFFVSNSIENSIKSTWLLNFERAAMSAASQWNIGSILAGSQVIPHVANTYTKAQIRLALEVRHARIYSTETDANVYQSETSLSDLCNMPTILGIRNRSRSRDKELFLSSLFL